MSIQCPVHLKRNCHYNRNNRSHAALPRLPRFPLCSFFLSSHSPSVFSTQGCLVARFSRCLVLLLSEALFSFQCFFHRSLLVFSLQLFWTLSEALFSDLLAAFPLLANFRVLSKAQRLSSFPRGFLSIILQPASVNCLFYILKKFNKI